MTTPSRSTSDPAVLFVANGGWDSAAAERARRFAAAMKAQTRVLVRSSGRLRSVRQLVGSAATFGPDLVYCVDLAAVPVLVALSRQRTARIIVDAGDHPSAFLRLVRAHRCTVAAARAMEEVVYRTADAVVVRGLHHAAVMRGHGVTRVAIIPDGVDLDHVTPEVDTHLRARLRLDRVLTCGIAGHFTWYERLGGGLGWELVHALALLRDLPVHAVLLGSGPGIPRLRELSRQLGVADRLHILGAVPYAEYGRYLTLIDICLLTQTNDPSSWVRTTGKLPGYMAAGRYILASAVGTAQAVLPEEMLVPYEGRWDEQYPARLAGRIRELATNRDRLVEGLALRRRAQEFAYPKVSAMAACLAGEVLGKRKP